MSEEIDVRDSLTHKLELLVEKKAAEIEVIETYLDGLRLGFPELPTKLLREIGETPREERLRLTKYPY